MQKIDLFADEYWQPLVSFGYTNSFFNLNKHTIIDTWIVLVLLCLLIALMRYFLARPESIGHFVLMKMVSGFRDLYDQTMPHYSYEHFTFAFSLFIFILLCNTSTVLPFIEEPTANLNTTLALAVASFTYTQVASIIELGFIGFLKHFIQPLAFLLPLNIIEKLATIVSLSLRLFGNIFGGMLLTKIYLGAIGGVFTYELIATLIGVNFIITGFFSIFEGFIQAFVFTILSMTYLSIATSHDEEEHA